MNNDTEKRTETHACDCISRSAVVDALYDWSEHSMTDAESWHIRQVIGDIKSLPPAEPNCSEIPNNSDCISRQAAITTIQKAYADTEGGTDKCAVWKNVGLTNALHIMQDLPPAQSASYRQVTGKLDCASRQAAIDAWKADFKGYVDCLDLLRDDYNGIMEYIDETPSAQPEQRWIPYWHKYPDNNRFVLVCNDDGRMAIAQYIGHEEDAYHPWQIAYCPYDVDVWDEDENGKIVAWMDLPKPYKENTNDGNGSFSAFEKLRTRILRREYGQNTTAQLRPEQRNNGHTGKSDTDAD